jgi:uncharacterized protein (TIGR00369 family)
MAERSDVLSRLREASKLSAFNTWLDLEIVEAREGEVELRLRSRPEFGQYSGFLHAGIVAGLIDTACGFAAATVSGTVLASQFSVRCLRPAVAETFVVKGHVLKPGRQQVFATAELFGAGHLDKPFAVGDAILVPVPAPADGPFP